jgi:hypothetical protein
VCDFLRKWRHDYVEPRDLFLLKIDKPFIKKLVRNITLVVINNDSLKYSKCLESKDIVFPIPKNPVSSVKQK